ncbi:DUF454 domain-containing protein [Staphylococcus condimenti]|uniref:DUF454 domain-containing protein n=1 Tax=Staphylococcus condimenti TaxID=70255 RepID=A0A143PAS0_9STAP|nr:MULTISPECIES: YbaN family protein [Staphylococcus]AMY05625.1 hypothetical protein A4G25_06600 [Staphylococcus condimenti]APR61831.1 hypothetical protein BTZ13_11625 [Staphylococcus condimenti]MDK8645630.1 YbaN family protein [Staphylococcus condimenti]OFO99392.1 hypothetical protein HMPREF3007_05830 [Staphylococcus sp. HMSC065E08]PNZ59962.1 DUF454 domain-containing protein [Staphylococcus condimenti]
MKYLLVTLGIIFAGIGFVGIVVPLLPTTPFLLLAAICFSRSSKKFNRWLVNTKIYDEYVESFKRDRGFTLKKKFKILTSLYILMGISIFIIDNFYIRITLLIMLFIQTVVLFTFVRTLPDNTKPKEKEE